MKRALVLFLTFYSGFVLQAQESLNINLLSTLNYDEDLSDIWGYATDDGEYALVGVYNGISVVDVTDPSNISELAFFSGPQSIWRDLKTWGNYLYCINDQNGFGGAGLQIVNLSEVIDGVENPTYIEHMGLGFSTAHNIYIDENGVLYVFGSNYSNGGCEMYDLTVDPEDPVFLGVFDDYYLHDGMVRGDTLWGGAVYNGVFSVVDVSDKSNPVIMASQSTPNTFSHNCWISDDGDYLYTTDEVSGAFVAAYDVSDLNNIHEVDKIQAWSGYDDVIPHNTHVNGNFIVTSYYTDGLSVVDVTHPSNMVEVGYYDTSEDFSGNGFHGAWGTYPWLPSGNIIVSDIEAGLFVLEPKYTQAGYLEGQVFDSETGMPLSNASVSIQGVNGFTYTALDGSYETGVANEEVYQVIFSAPGYNDQIVELNFVSGEVLSFDVQLSPFDIHQVEFSVVDAVSLVGLEGVSVALSNEDFDLSYNTNESGFIYTSLSEGEYEISINSWGYGIVCDTISLSSAGTDYYFELVRSYEDNFSADLGWVIDDGLNLTAGAWERGIPNATYYNGELLNPASDSDQDCGGMAFVTGNQLGVEYYEGDVDGGVTRILSPLMDLSTYENPVLNFSTWFVNTGGDGVPNDSLLIKITNSLETVLLDYRNVSSSSSAWVSHEIPLSDVIALTEDMRLVVEVMDQNSTGHLVEAGFDDFSITDSELGVGVNELLVERPYPNPSTDGFMNFNLKDETYLTVHDVTGKIVYSQSLSMGIQTVHLAQLNTGVYLIQLKSEIGNESFLWICE